MKCIYCGKKTERFLDITCRECYDKYLNYRMPLLTVCKDYEEGKIEHKKAVQTLVELSQKESHYNEVLLQDIDEFKDIIRKSDCPIYISKYFTVAEEKNSCRMKSIGWGETRPSWNVEKKTLSNFASVLITDKNLYIDLSGTKMLFSLNKIELVKEDNLNTVYFDIKTSSPYPHRLYFIFKNEREKYESNLYYFLSCISGK